MPTTTCPSHDELHTYSVGLLSDTASETIAAHVASCPTCRAGLSTFDGVEDTFLNQLRRPTVADPYLEESQCQVAVARACNVPDVSRVGRAKRSLCGKTVGEYHLISELGQGGMGTVYKALHTKLDRVVALKVLSCGGAADGPAISRFEREMRAVGKISHPNVVQAHDAREIDGMPVLIMEFVDGLDLAQIVRRSGPLAVADACEVVRRTALGLQQAHEHGLVHRDVKPSNIMLTQAGEVKLLDLGLARFYAESATGEEMTGTGQAMGTADYMAPEQASDCRTVDIRADLYSLGCTLYKLLVGRAPFSGPEYVSALDKMNAHVHQPVPPIRQLAPRVPDGLAALLDRLLAKDLADRFATPADVAAALEPFCGGANLAELVTRASAEDSLSAGESARVEQPESCPLALRERVRVRADGAPIASHVRRRPILSAILFGLAFLGALAAAFAAGILITIKKDGQTYQVEAPPNSHTTVDEKGNATVSIPGGAESGEASAVNASAELRALQHEWKVVRVEKGKHGDSSWAAICSNGLALDPATTARLDFRPSPKDTLIVKRRSPPPLPHPEMDPPWYVQSFGYRLDPTASPKRIDLVGAYAGGFAGVDALGTYELEGDRLKIRLVRRLAALKEEAQRPKDFAIDPDCGDILLVLERYRAEDEMRILGSWSVVTQTVNGEAVPEANRHIQKWFFSENYFEVNRVFNANGIVIPGRVVHAPFILDGSHEPKRITLLRFPVDVRSGNVQDITGIYRLDGDRLHIAYGQSDYRVTYGPPTYSHGDALPQDFQSRPDSKVTVWVLQGLSRPGTPGTPRAAGEQGRSSKPSSSKAPQSSSPSTTPAANAAFIPGGMPGSEQGDGRRS